jgi:hypothetical protein
MAKDKWSCKFCGQGVGSTLIGREDARGKWFVELKCKDCGGWQNPKKKYWDQFKDRIVGISNRKECCAGYGCPKCEVTSCRVCGSYEYVEQHHWLPTHIVKQNNLSMDDYLLWPTDILCQECHRLWHKLVTPNMSKSKLN